MQIPIQVKLLEFDAVCAGFLAARTARHSAIALKMLLRVTDELTVISQQEHDNATLRAILAKLRNASETITAAHERLALERKRNGPR